MEGVVRTTHGDDDEDSSGAVAPASRAVLEVVSMISKDSAERLGLVDGNEVAAIIKGTDVIVATD